MKQRIEIRSLKRRDKKELSRLLRRQEGRKDMMSFSQRKKMRIHWQKQSQRGA